MSISFGMPGARGVGQVDRGGHREPAHHRLVDRVHVDGLVEGLAHALVLERVLALHVRVEQLVARLVHAEEDDAVLAALVDLDALVLLELLDVLHRRVEDEVEVAGEERRHARALVLHRRVDDVVDVAVEVALLLEAPPVGVLLEDALHVGLARDEDEGPGAHGVPRRCSVSSLFVKSCALHGVVLLAPGLVHDEEAVGEHLEHHGVGHRRGELHRVVVDLPRLAHGVAVDAEVGGLALQALDREHHVVGGEVASRRAT